MHASAPSSPRVAVLYSGRWNGYITQSLVENHLRSLILPNLPVHVVVAVSPSQWCVPGGPKRGTLILAEHGLRQNETWSYTTQKAKLEADVENVFQAALRKVTADPKSVMRQLHVQADLIDDGAGKLDLDHQQAKRAAAQHGSAPLSNLELRGGHNWRHQATKLVRAEALRRASGREADVVIRARLDALFTRNISVKASINFTSDAFRKGRIVYAYQRLMRNISYLRDWTFVTSPKGMSDIFSKFEQSTLLHNAAMRCGGLCPEEQWWQQILHAGAQVARLDDTWYSLLERRKCDPTLLTT